jgi:hypothetical protein
MRRLRTYPAIYRILNWKTDGFNFLAQCHMVNKSLTQLAPPLWRVLYASANTDVVCTQTTYLWVDLNVSVITWALQIAVADASRQHDDIARLCFNLYTSIGIAVSTTNQDSRLASEDA